MERKVNVLEHSHVEVLVTVDEATWKAAQGKAFKKVAANIDLPGFRKGKAPESLVRSKVDQVKVMDEAVNALLPTIYKDILDNEDIRPFAQPKVDVTKISDTELEVKFLIVTTPRATLGKYKDFDIGKVEVKVTDEEVNAEIDALRKQNATLVIKDGPAALGDVVVIDFVGSVDGKEFDGGKGENYELELGSHSFIPGFEEQLVGTKAGEDKDVNVTFPEQYTPELKGKKALFKCKVHEVKQKKLPELDDEFIRDVKIQSVTNVEELKANKFKELTDRKEKEEKNKYIGKVLESIAKEAKVDIPDEVVEDQVASRKRDLMSQMSQSGMTMESYLQIIGQTQEEFDAKIREDSIKAITNFLIIEEIAEKEGLTVSDEELEFELAKIADQYKMKMDDVKKALANSMEQFRNNVKHDRVEKFLFDNNN